MSGEFSSWGEYLDARISEANAQGASPDYLDHLKTLRSVAPGPGEKDLHPIEFGTRLGIRAAKQQLHISEAKILHEQVSECFLRNAPLHQKRCKEVMEKYANHISQQTGFRRSTSKLGNLRISHTFTPFNSTQFCFLFFL